MTEEKYNDLKGRAKKVRYETVESQNDAERVGGLLVDMIEDDKNTSNIITGLANDIKDLKGRTKDLQDAISSGVGPGSGNGTATIESVNYHLKKAHSNNYPKIPTVSMIGGPSTTDINVTETIGNETVTYTWVKGSVPDSEDGEDIWRIIVQFVNKKANAVIGPIRIKNGGIEGTTSGEDTDEIEFIYCCPEGKSAVSWGPENTDALTTYDEGKIKGEQVKNFNGYFWRDHPYGISDTHRYEYYSYRTSSIEDGIVKWSTFCQPLIWSRWGEDGTDGDGVEYIFIASQSGTFPYKLIGSVDINDPTLWDNDGTAVVDGKNGKTFQDNEFIADDSDWMDNPIDLSDSNYGPGSKEWVSIRKKQYVTRTIDEGSATERTETTHEWTKYSPPALWSGVGSDSVVSGYVVDLVNENMPVVVDVNGTIVSSNYSNQARVQVQDSGVGLLYMAEPVDGVIPSGYFSYRVKDGGVVYSDNRTYGANDPIQYQISGADFNISIDETLQNFSGVTCNITLEVLLPGTNNISILICTLYGVHIEGVENIDMYVGAPCIHANSEGTNPSPMSLPVGVKIGKGRSTTITYYSGDISSSNGSAEDQHFWFKWYFDDNPTSKHSLGGNNPAGGNIPLSEETDAHTAITVEMYYGEAFNGQLIPIDSERIPYVRDGAASTNKGIDRVTRFYKAQSSNATAPTMNTSLTPDDLAMLHSDDWWLDNMSAGWGPNKRYLYYCDYTKYTDGSGNWEAVQFDKDWIITETINGADGYSVIVTPSYAIFEEEIIENQDGSTSTRIDTSSWSAKIKILKGNNPEFIWYHSGGTYTYGNNCTFSITGDKNGGKSISSSDDNNELTVTVDTITSGQITGNIHITVQRKGKDESNYSDFVAIDIPIYINRIGSRIVELKGDLETDIRNKTQFIVDGAVVRIEELATYLTSSTVSKTTFNTTVGDINKKISDFELSSGALTSKIENLNIGTKNYFNFTCAEFKNGAIPFIQGYGLEVKAEGSGANNTKFSQVQNLDFEGKGGDFVVTCQMKVQSVGSGGKKQVLVGLCDINPSNIESNGGYVDVNTSWNKYTFIYNVPDNKTNPNGVNGHITFISKDSTINGSNRLYVKELMIARGNTVSNFNTSWRDYESQASKEQALIVGDNGWNYNNLTIQNEKYKGFNIYKCSAETISANADLISAAKVKTKQNKIYTLSFYAKTDVAGNTSNDLNADNTNENNGGGRQAFIYDNGDAIDGTITPTDGTLARQVDVKYNTGSPSIANKVNGETNYKLNNSWQQFIIHWYNQKKNGGTTPTGWEDYMRSIIAMRYLSGAVTKFSVAGVELREGWWDADGINSSSLIRQTADEIEMKVKDTGINIDDGTIELNADKTTIKGGLNLYGGNQGLKIYDEGGGESISIFPDKIEGIKGTGTNEKEPPYSYETGIEKYIEQEQDPVNGEFRFSESIGYVTRGSTVRINRILITAIESMQHPNATCTLVVKIGTNTIIGPTTISNIPYSYSEYYGYSITNRYGSSNYEGEAVVELKLTGANSRKCTMHLWVETVGSGLSKIGKDGAVFAYDEKDFHWFGPTQSVISHGNTQLSIDNTGIYNEGCDIGGKVNVKVLNGLIDPVPDNNRYDLSPTDTFIFIDSTYHRDIAIYLPDSSKYKGKIYYMKNCSSNTIRVYYTSKNIMASGNSGTQQSIPLNDDSQMFISTGTYWVHFRCD